MAGKGSQEPSPILPEKIGAYRVLRAIGNGGMGEVLLVHDERLEREVAIKRVHRQDRNDGSSQDRFLREARAAAKLNHPAIVQVHDIFQDESGHNIVMEYVEGKTIAQLLRGGPLFQEQALQLAIEIAEGLAEAHRRGVVHRDLKAENVILTPAGRVKILDFGLAKQLDLDESLTATGQLLGTWRSMSPEQARGEKVDQRTDLFSLGVLLYEMLTGRSPFRGENAMRTLHNVQYEQPEPLTGLLPEINPNLVSLINWLLQKEPHKRPFRAGQVAQIFKQIAAQSGSAMPLLPPLQPSVELKEGPGETGRQDPSLEEASPSGHPTRSRLETNEEATRIDPSGKSAWRGWRARWFMPLALLALLSVVGIFWVRANRAPLRVVVTAPELEGEGAEADLLVAGVLEATLDGLTSLEGLSVLDPNQIGGQGEDAVSIAHAVAADELFSASVHFAPAYSRVTLRRINGEDGALLSTRSFEVPSAVADSLLAAETVVTRVRDAYREHRTRPGAPRLEAREEDHAEFLRLLKDVDKLPANFAAEKENIEALLEGSPRFFAAFILAGTNALAHYTNTGDLESLRLAAGYRDRAEEIAPHDIRYLRLHLNVSLAENQFEQAETVLAELTRLEPGSAQTLVLRSRLAEKNGDLTGAIDHMREAVKRRADWLSLYRIANLELQAGEVDAARLHLEQLLRVTPGNIWGMGSLASAEMLYGDLERAESLFADAARLLPHKSFFANLGTTRYWMGEYGDAEAAYLQALELAPEDPSLLLGLADSKMARGSKDAALEIYARALEQLNRQEALAGLKSMDALIKAQCLAYLGQLDEAVALTLQTLQENPDHAEIAYQAALVYAVAGERSSVLACAKTALDKGIQPRWFSAPAFDSFRSESGFANLFDR